MSPAAHWPCAYQEFDGITTRRRLFQLGKAGTVSRDTELVTIDIESVRFI
ncbi:hypothetical protein ACFRAI_42520 [Streptomyces sp. NPDC056637]